MTVELRRCFDTFEEFETSELPELVDVLAEGLRTEAEALHSVGGSPEKLAWRLVNRDCLGVEQLCSWERWIKRVPQDLLKRCETRAAATAQLVDDHLSEALQERDSTPVTDTASVTSLRAANVEAIFDARAWRGALSKSRKVLEAS